MQNENPTTQKKIFDASVKLFSDLGFARVSMRDIAKSVGISVAAIYNHFPSKDSLLDAMYDFFNKQRELYLPDTEAALALCETAPLPELFSKFVFYYEEGTRETLDRIVAIAIGESRSDKRSADFINKCLLQLPDSIVIPVLQRLIDIGRIEPLDLEGIRILFANYTYAAAVRNYSLIPIGFSDWTKGLQTLLSLVKPKK
ncbi:MAG: TetR/AcrR family transcriptional regulator [Clostridiales Family XIII bacterium]|jgi:AcrR family transcriptional regulator|nr:TetR/AcrR family transcriptional regulator [Clostridiales Family XIII bacterium]